MNFEFKRIDGKVTFVEHCANEGDNFEVEIVHWRMYRDNSPIEGLSPFLNNNECWNVYAIIKSGHPLFDKLKDIKTDDYYGAADNFPFPFHGGITYVHNNIDNIKIGDDYMHYSDDYFWKCKTLPVEVKHEAEELFDFLSEGI